MSFKNTHTETPHALLTFHTVIIPFAIRPSDKTNQNLQMGRKKEKKKQVTPMKTNRNKGLDWFFPLRM